MQLIDSEIKEPQAIVVAPTENLHNNYTMQRTI